MFLTYINELISILEEFGVVMKLFAGDVKMYVTIVNDVGVAQLQHAVSALVDWACEWQLAISIENNVQLLHTSLLITVISCCTSDT